MLQLHDNLEDYSEEEKLALKHAYIDLEIKAQDGVLTIDETRIRVAYVRLLREENFKISQPTVRATSTRKKKEPALESLLDELAGGKLPKQKRITKVKVEKQKATPKQANVARAGMLFFQRNRGEQLTDEENAFLDAALEAPEVL